MAKKTTNNRMVHSTLINTWETYDNIEKQYVDSDNDLCEESRKIMNYINGLEEFNRKVFILYAEYASLRKVAEETNRSKDVIMQVINKIRVDIFNKKHIL